MTPRWSELREGDALPPLALRPTVDQSVRYCALAWVFPRFFFDPAAAHAQGMPGTLVPGPLKLGFLYRAVDEWLGDAGFIRQVRAAHRRPDLTGDPITVTGRIARLFEENGRHQADIEMEITNKDGQPSVRGFASVQFHPPHSP